MSVLVTLLGLTASWDLHGHPTPTRRDGVWRAAGHWDQHPARAWPRVNRSWADPACAHSSASATTAGPGGFTMILPKPSLRLKPRGTNVGIPPVHGGHPAGTGSLVTTWSAVCRGHGAPREPQATARDHCAPARWEQAHLHIASAALKGQLLAINHLQAGGSGQK